MVRASERGRQIVNTVEQQQRRNPPPHQGGVSKRGCKRKVGPSGVPSYCNPTRIAPVRTGVGSDPLHSRPNVVECRREGMLRSKPIIEVDGKKARSGEAHADLAKTLRTAERPTAAVQVENDWKWRRAGRHRDIGVEGGAQTDLLVKGTDNREVAVEFLGMAFPGLPGGDDIGGRVPIGERTQDRPVTSRHGRHAAFTPTSCRAAAAATTAGAPRRGRPPGRRSRRGRAALSPDEGRSARRHRCRTPAGSAVARR
jgi:hypothetical protein